LHAFIQILSYLIRAPTLAETVAIPAGGDILDPDEPVSPQSITSLPLRSPRSPRSIRSPGTRSRTISFGSATDAEVSSVLEFASANGMQLPLIQSSEVHHRAVGVEQDGAVDWRRSIASSLMVGVVTEYANDFTLMALANSTNYFPRLVSDLREMSKHPIAGAVAAASCILINLNTRECDVLTVDEREGKRSHTSWEGEMYEGLSVTRGRKAQHVRDTLMTTISMFHHGLPDIACEEYFESRLQELQARAELVQQYIESCPASEEITETKLGQALGVADDDIPLLLNIAAVDSPNIRWRVKLAL